MPRFNSNLNKIFLARRYSLSGISGLICHLDATNPESYPGSGTGWYDISGNNNHFTWNSTVNRFSTVWKNFNWGNDVYGMENACRGLTTNRYNFGNKVSVLFWYRYPGDISGTNRYNLYRPIINNGHLVQGGICILANYYNMQAGVTTKITSTSGDVYTANTSTPISVDQWAHYAMVYNGGTIATYKNGILQGQTGKSGNIPVRNRELTIGRGNVGGGYDTFTWGRLNSFRIYKTALTQRQINLIYQSELIKYTGPGLAEPLVTNGLVFHADGNMATDLVTGTAGQATGSPSYSTSFGGFTAFNGSNRYMYNTDGVSDYLSGMTVSAFVRFYDASRAVIYEKILPGSSYYGRGGRGFIFFRDGQKLKLTFGTNTYVDIEVSTRTTLPTNKWFHVAVVFENGLGAARVKLYINGDIDPTYTYSPYTGNSNLLSTTRPAYVGGGGNWYAGQSGSLNLGRLAVYNRPLSAEEIYQNFRADNARFGVY